MPWGFTKNKCPGKELKVITKDKALEIFETKNGKNWLCNYFISEGNSIDFSNKNLELYQSIARIIKLKCPKEEETILQ